MLLNIQTLKQITEYVFKQQHSNVSFPLTLTDEILKPFGYVVLNTTTQPEYDSWLQELSEGIPELKDDGKWYQTWVLKPIVHTPEEEQNYLNRLKNKKIKQIDQETSDSILSGFDYTINNTKYHFSYDSFDQQNFADAANTAVLSQIQSNVKTIPTDVNWNSYVGKEKKLEIITLNASEFLDLYVNGALVHKNTKMQIAGQRKAEVSKAQSKEDLDKI